MKRATIVLGYCVDAVVVGVGTCGQSVTVGDKTQLLALKIANELKNNTDAICLVADLSFIQDERPYSGTPALRKLLVEYESRLIYETAGSLGEKGVMHAVANYFAKNWQVGANWDVILFGAPSFVWGAREELLKIQGEGVPGSMGIVLRTLPNRIFGP